MHTHHRLSLVPGAPSGNRKNSMSGRQTMSNQHAGQHNHVDQNHVDGRSPTRKSIEQLELESCKRALAPRVEGRIIKITDEEVCLVQSPSAPKGI